MDRELRGVITFLTSYTSWSIREKFGRLIHMTLLLNLERVADVSDLALIPDAPRLAPEEMKKVLKRRIDFTSEEIDVMKQ